MIEVYEIAIIFLTGIVVVLLGLYLYIKFDRKKRWYDMWQKVYERQADDAMRKER